MRIAVYRVRPEYPQQIRISMPVSEAIELFGSGDPQQIEAVLKGNKQPARHSAAGLIRSLRRLRDGS